MVSQKHLKIFNKESKICDWDKSEHLIFGHIWSLCQIVMESIANHHTDGRYSLRGTSEIGMIPTSWGKVAHADHDQCLSHIVLQKHSQSSKMNKILIEMDTQNNHNNCNEGDLSLQTRNYVLKLEKINKKSNSKYLKSDIDSWFSIKKNKIYQYIKNGTCKDRSSRKLFINDQVLIIYASNKLYFYILEFPTSKYDQQHKRYKQQKKIVSSSDKDSKVKCQGSQKSIVADDVARCVLIGEYKIQSERAIDKDLEQKTSVNNNINTSNPFAMSINTITDGDGELVNTAANINSSRGICLIEYDLVDPFYNEYYVKFLIFGGNGEKYRFYESLLMISCNVRLTSPIETNDDIDIDTVRVSNSNHNINHKYLHPESTVTGKVYDINEIHVDIHNENVMCNDALIEKLDSAKWKENKYFACCKQNGLGDNIVIMYQFSQAILVFVNLETCKIYVFSSHKDVVGACIGTTRVEKQTRLDQYRRSLMDSSITKQLQVPNLIIQQIVSFLDGYKYVATLQFILSIYIFVQFM